MNVSLAAVATARVAIPQSAWPWRIAGAISGPVGSTNAVTTSRSAELALWKQAVLEPWPAEPARYREIGQGMDAALNAASAMGAYVLADRGTWIGFKNNSDLVIAVEGEVSTTKHSHVKKHLGQAFIDWITGPDGQNAIRSHNIEGQQLFFPNVESNQLGKRAA